MRIKARYFPRKDDSSVPGLAVAVSAVCSLIQLNLSQAQSTILAVQIADIQIVKCPYTVNRQPFVTHTCSKMELFNRHLFPASQAKPSQAKPSQAKPSLELALVSGGLLTHAFTHSQEFLGLNVQSQQIAVGESVSTDIEFNPYGNNTVACPI